MYPFATPSKTKDNFVQLNSIVAEFSLWKKDDFVDKKV